MPEATKARLLLASIDERRPGRHVKNRCRLRRNNSDGHARCYTVHSPHILGLHRIQRPGARNDRHSIVGRIAHPPQRGRVSAAINRTTLAQLPAQMREDARSIEKPTRNERFHAGRCAGIDQIHWHSIRIVVSAPDEIMNNGLDLWRNWPRAPVRLARCTRSERRKVGHWRIPAACGATKHLKRASFLSQRTIISRTFADCHLTVGSRLVCRHSAIHLLLHYR